MFGAVGASRGNSKEVKEEMQSVQPAPWAFGLICLTCTFTVDPDSAAVCFHRDLPELITRT